MAKTTPGAFAELVANALKLLDKWFSSERIRNSLAANKVALKFMRRVKKLEPGLYENDKYLKKHRKKFVDLTVSH